MRASVASLTKKFISTFFAATLALGLVPAAAFAVDDENSESANADHIEMTNDVISSEADEVGADEKSASIEQNEAEGLTTSSEEAVVIDNASGSEDVVSIPAATQRVNEDVTLMSRTVAQAESTHSYFLAQTLESTRTVPIVSANLPLDTSVIDEPAEDNGILGDEGGEDSDGSDLFAASIAAESIVVGSFEYRGITYAVEPGGESVAVVAADYSKLPEEFIEAQVIVLPSMVTSDGVDYYSVTRIADNAFSTMKPQDAEEAITAITIPASVTEIGDDAFSGFDTLQYVIVSEDNPNYGMYDGCLYDAELTSLLLIPEGRLGAVRIASSVTSVDPEVFSHCPLVDTLVADADSAAYQLLEEGDFDKREFVFRLVESESEEEMAVEFLSDIVINEKEVYAASSCMLYANGVENGASGTTKAYLYVDKYPGSNKTTGTIGTKTPVDYGSSTYAPSWTYGAALTMATAAWWSNDTTYWNATPHRVGYEFKGWSTNAGASSGSGTSPIAGASYYAIWSNSTYAVSFHKNGGSGGQTGGVTASFDKTMPAITTTEPTRDGYTFGGWYDTAAATGGTQYYTAAGASARTWNKTAETILYARWIANDITLKWDSNGGSAVSDTTQTFSDGAKVALPTTPTREGYAFKGWFTSTTSTSQITSSTALPSSNITYYAQWTANDITMTWNAHNGIANTTSTQKCDADLVLPTQPTRAGYTFAGWWTAETGGTQITSTSKVPTSNTTYHAHWTASDIIMTWNAHNGTTNTTSTQKCDATLNLPTQPTKTGYTFAGWWTEEGGGTQVSASTKVPTVNTTYHAHWTVSGYTIDYDGNEATGGSTASTSATYDANVTFAKCGFERTGYTFKEWNTKADGTGTAYSAETEYTKPNLAGSGSATLYAVWTQDNYRIEFVAIDPVGESVNHYVPSGSVDPITDAVYGEALSDRSHSAAALTCTGYELLGWSTNRDATELDDTFLFNGRGEGLGTYAKEGNTTLYSIWKPRTVTVVFRPNAAGMDEVETAQTFNAGLKDVPTFSRFGYEPDGWYRNEQGTGDALDTTGPFRPSETDLDAEEIVYFVKWKPVAYRVTLYPGEHGSYSAETEDAVADGGVRGGYKLVHGYTVEEDEYLFTKPKPEGGYKFAGWQQLVDEEWKDCAGSVDPDSFKAGSALSFQAKWTATEATVTLDLNGAPASEQPSGFSTTLAYSIDREAQLPTPVWEGHTFLGWKLVERGGAEVDPAEDVASIKGVTGTVPEDVVCEAEWVSDTYTVKFLRSSSYPTEIAPSQTVGREDAIAFVAPSFTQAFDLDRAENQARIFMDYKIPKDIAGTGADVRFYPADPSTSVGALMKAYPRLVDSEGETPKNGSTIVFYADWELNYNVVVPLKASIAFDPERIMEDPDTALKPDSVAMKLLDQDASPVEVVSLICEPTSTTASAFDGNKAFYDHTYLTLSAKQRSATDDATVPVELNLGAAIEKGSIAVRDVKSGGDVLSLPEAGFSFGGTSTDDRILDLTYGIRFDSSVDPSRLSFLNAPSFKNTGDTIDLANVYYTLALKRASA